jgi:hypothetical protein
MFVNYKSLCSDSRGLSIMARCDSVRSRVPSCRLGVFSITTPRAPSSKRCYSQSTPTLSPPPSQQTPRWLSDLKLHIGRCLTFGLKLDQTQEAASILEELAKDWRELVAGSEGFLTGLGRRTLRIISIRLIRGNGVNCGPREETG